MIVIQIAALLAGIALFVGAIALFFIETGPNNPLGQAFSLVWVRFVTFPIALALFTWGINGIYTSTRRSRHAKAKKKTKTAAEKTRVYESTDSRSTLLAEVPEGTNIDVGPISEVDGADWTNVKLVDGKQGYVLGRMRYYEVLKAALEQATPVYDSRETSSPGTQLPPGTEVEINAFAWDSIDHSTAEAWLNDGKKVFIKSNTRVKWL